MWVRTTAVERHPEKCYLFFKFRNVTIVRQVGARRRNIQKSSMYFILHYMFSKTRELDRDERGTCELEFVAFDWYDWSMFWHEKMISRTFRRKINTTYVINILFEVEVIHTSCFTIDILHSKYWKVGNVPSYSFIQTKINNFW